ncbi:hypothetical protein [Nocardia sp. XZ_19_369]|uniref:hypothetical protein n=1 Tax=Nocardia sp. XZ_19_369 TaxID=2769487 RepID=UPI00188FE156|nr:hypothetical protein [Nocardia sp. XZ_19_369]
MADTDANPAPEFQFTQADPADAVLRGRRTAATGPNATRAYVSNLITNYRDQVRAAAATSDQDSVAAQEWLDRLHADIGRDIRIVKLSDRDRAQALEALTRARNLTGPDRPVFKPSVWQNLKDTIAARRDRTQAPHNQPRSPSDTAPSRQLAQIVPSGERPARPADPKSALGQNISREALLRLCDDLPGAVFTQTGAVDRLQEHLSSGVLDPAETERARAVAAAVVTDAWRGVRFDANPRALIIFAHRFEMWHEARPYLRDASESDGGPVGRKTAPSEEHRLDPAILLARPRTLTAAPTTGSASDPPLPPGPESAAAAEVVVDASV